MSTIIGEYEVLKKIGEGGFCKTFLARHRVLGSLVCMKQALELSDTDKKLLIAEAKLLFDLDYYCLPGCKGVIDDPEYGIILIQRYVAGAELYKLVETEYKAGLDPEHVCWILQRTLETLRYLHAYGIIHGDVKPQNLILEESDEYPGCASHAVWLVDFGLATVRPGRHSKPDGYTPAFAAPEQISGMPPLPETDLYCLGATAIYALGGDIGSLTMPRSVPSELQSFISEMVRRDPLKRPEISRQSEMRKFQKRLSDIRLGVFGKRASGKPLELRTLSRKTKDRRR